MEKNEIKKALYNQNPTADFQYIRKGKAIYSVKLNVDNIFGMNGIVVFFEIPVEDMGDADFGLRMEAKLLQRWMM